MNLAETAINWIIKGLTRIICRIHNEQVLDNVPAVGPLIIVANHVNMLETPLVYTHLYPRQMTGFAKIESWDSWFIGRLFNMWGLIPIRRGEADLTAIKRGVGALNDGLIFVLAPEGTRSKHGRLLRGHSGVIMLATLANTPILPMVCYGHENLFSNLKRLRRTDYTFQLGSPFKIVPPQNKSQKSWRQDAADEVMYQLATLLPPEYRGEYENLEKATQIYIEFISS